MRYFVVFFLVALANTVGAQEATTTQSISGTIVIYLSWAYFTTSRISSCE
jgi:hypothetical protein